MEAATFYSEHYQWTKPLCLRPGMPMVVLGNRDSPVCRFCNRSEPDVSFRHNAHAIPEALGNKTIFTKYECDRCNDYFGRTIENDLGNWSKPSRTISCIHGKNGVPTLKKSGAGVGWRIEYNSNGFYFEDYETDPHFTVDEQKRRITFELNRDPYTPVAVLKAFVKIGLTLIPPKEIPNFTETLTWICDRNHNASSLIEWPVFWTYRPGPMPNDLLVAILLRRKRSLTSVPYASLVLSYGNDVFQVWLPAPRRDSAIVGRKLTLPVFQMPNGPDPRQYGKPYVKLLDLCERGIVQGETVQAALGFDTAIVQDSAGFS